MVQASISSIATAIDAALATLGPTASPPGPFKGVGRFARDTSIRIGEQIQKACLNRNPSALVELELGEPNDSGSFESLAGRVQEVDRTTFVVYVCTSDTRSVDVMTKGSTSQPGLYALVDAVIDALNGLKIRGLYRSGMLAYRGYRWITATEGVAYAIGIRFTAEHVLNNAPRPDVSVPFLGMDATVGFPANVDAPPPDAPLVTPPNTMTLDTPD